ncbi:hypothetical protein C7974DRAFT_402576 [Boeremia exigua]|uniref:uncharacterized protein n=1 Tax=Boeremia exigua TaxID=749465 RepID=UPI001E8EA48B|nr:uncharacterized protein C7974DRAFT_402576 [Boeremia exigua]KAH6616870.1 hypothetical protein C7974DRAFT_402576 [Boeremia exigua]
MLLYYFTPNLAMSALLMLRMPCTAVCSAVCSSRCRRQGGEDAWIRRSECACDEVSAMQWGALAGSLTWWSHMVC